MANLCRFLFFSLAAVAILSFHGAFALVHQTAARARNFLREGWGIITAPVASAADYIERTWRAAMLLKRTPAYARTSAFAQRIKDRSESRRHGAALNYGISGCSLA